MRFQVYRYLVIQDRGLFRGLCYKQAHIIATVGQKWFSFRLFMYPVGWVNRNVLDEIDKTIQKLWKGEQ